LRGCALRRRGRLRLNDARPDQRDHDERAGDERHPILLESYHDRSVATAEPATTFGRAEQMGCISCNAFHFEAPRAADFHAEAQRSAEAQRTARGVAIAVRSSSPSTTLQSNLWGSASSRSWRRGLAPCSPTSAPPRDTAVSTANSNSNSRGARGGTRRRGERLSRPRCTQPRTVPLHARLQEQDFAVGIEPLVEPRPFTVLYASASLRETPPVVACPSPRIAHSASLIARRQSL
jgi:hypothetical protein